MAAGHVADLAPRYNLLGSLKSKFSLKSDGNKAVCHITTSLYIDKPLPPSPLQAVKKRNYI